MSSAENITKFGGAAMGGWRQIQQSCRVAEQHKEADVGEVMVVSAMENVTDTLFHAYDLALNRDTVELKRTLDGIRSEHLDALEEIVGTKSSTPVIKEIDEIIKSEEKLGDAISIFAEDRPSSKARFISIGEKLSPLLVKACFEEMGIPVYLADAASIIKTDDQYLDANPDRRLIKERIREELLTQLAVGKLIVIGGFFGSNKLGQETTFSRGGSDRTATILAKGLMDLGREILGVYLYKLGVGGVMSADPKKVTDAFVLPHLSRELAIYLSALGGKVIHSKAIQELEGTPITLFCRSVDHPNELGTVIDETEDDPSVQIITSQWPLKAIRIAGKSMDIPNIAGRSFGLIGGENINIRAIYQTLSERSLEFIVEDKANEELIVEQLETLLRTHITSKDITTISARPLSAVGIIGSSVKENGVRRKINGVLYNHGDGRLGERVLHTSIDSHLISIIFDDPDGIYATQAAQAIHAELYNKNSNL